MPVLKKLLLTLFTLLLLPSINVIAAERSASVNLTSNYVFRGFTQTDDKAAVQVNYQLSQTKDSGWYIGFFTSNVSQGAEIDVFAGAKLALGKNRKFILDFGAVEYLYTDNNFADPSHEFYMGAEYELSYLKYYFGEDDATYLDLGIGFYIVSDMEVILHYGSASSKTLDSNDISATLQKSFGATQLGVTATYEDRSAAKESELFAFIKMEF